MEVFNIVPCQQGSVIATCSVHIPQWHLKIHKVKVLRKSDGSTFIGMPSYRQEINGEFKFFDTVELEGDVKNRFRDRVSAEVKTFLEASSCNEFPGGVLPANDFPF